MGSTVVNEWNTVGLGQQIAVTTSATIPHTLKHVCSGYGVHNSASHLCRPFESVNV